VGEHFISEHFPIRLGPAWVLRMNNLIGAVLIAGCGAVGVWGGFAVGFVAHQGFILTILGAPFALYGLIIAPLTLRLGVVLHTDRAVVRGYLSTETVPRAAVTAVTDYPSIEWTGPDGQPRETLVNALNVYRSGRASPSERMLAAIQAKVDVLRAWASHAPS